MSEQGDKETRRQGDKGSERVALIGFRGTGKSTVARLLAERVGWAWVDADALLEERAGRTIRDIFAEHGEAEFRRREAAILAELFRRPRTVLATGGGVILREDNRDLLRRSAWVVWLEADAQTLWRRLESDPTSAARRPALGVARNTASNSLSEIEELLKVREPLYRECADAVVHCATRDAAAVADEVERLWRTWHMAKHHSPGFLKIVNDAKQRVRETDVDKVKAMLDRGDKIVLIDVREESEYAKDHLPGAIHLGKGVIERDVEQRVPDTAAPLVLYCGGGFRSALAADNLQKMGYSNVLSMDGGIREWREKKYPLTTE
jgi:shikimate kinase/rhodanese-related sulfurtransferase